MILGGSFLRCQPAEMRIGVSEKNLEALTEMVEIFIPGVPDSILHAAAAAFRRPGASPAGFREACLSLPKFPLLWRVEEREHRLVHDIAQLPAGFDKKITGIEIAIVLHNPVYAAFRKEGAFGRGKTGIEIKQGIEKPNRGRRPVPRKIGQPKIKNPAKKVSVFRGTG